MPLILSLIAGIMLAVAPEDGAGSPDVSHTAADAEVASRLSAAAPATPEVPADEPVRREADVLADRAFNALHRLVPVQSHPEALRYAIDAYYNFRESNPDEVRKPYLYFVDFGLSSTQPRGYVFDMDKLRIVEGPFTVAHGRGSANGKAPVPTRFSNRPGSNATSLGLFVAAETYGFRGKSGGRPYRSIGLRMDGVSDGFNSAARRRGVVVHGAPYVTSSKAGRSEGCPAMEPERAQRLLPLLSGGSLVFLFSPHDREWLALEPWVDAEIASIIPKQEIVTLP